MKNKKKLIILSIVAILLIVVLSSASYAYFTTSGSTGSEETISSGTMALTFTDGPQINATNLAPGDYIEKTFSVTNTGTLATTYDVYLSEVVNTFVQKSDLVYELISNDGGYNTSSEVVVPNQEAKIVDTQSIAVGATHHYTLKITYKLTDQIQNDNMGRGFTAKISINEYNQNTTEKLLKLLDTSGNIVDKQMISSGVTDYYYNLANTSLTGTTNIYCNNGGIPRIENNQLIVTGLTVDTECKMSSDIQDTIANRLTTNKTGIVMTNNQDGISSMFVTSKEVVFDLNGKTINGVAVDTESTTWNGDHCGLVLNESTLTVNDTVGTGGIYTGKDGRVFFPVKNNYLIVNGGTFSGRQAVNTDSSSQDNNHITLNDGTYIGVSGQPAVAIGNGNANSTITINGGNYSTVSAATIQSNTGKIIINNGVFRNTNSSAFLINVNGSGEINGGDFETRSYRLINNFGEATINNGNFYTLNHQVVHNEATMTINGGNFHSSATGSTVIVNNASSAVINIEGGTYKADYHRTVYNGGGTINISGGNFESVDRETVDNTSGITNITGGVFNSQYRIIGNPGGGTVNISGGTYICNDNPNHKCSDVVNNSSGTININQTESPIYFGNTNMYGTIYSTYAIHNTDSGNVYINGSIANACNDNPNSTTSGLCLYCKNGRTVLNETTATGNIFMDGAYVVGEQITPFTNWSSGKMYAKNSLIRSYSGTWNNAVSLYDNGGAANPENSEMNICNSQVLVLNTSMVELYNNSAGIMRYYGTTFTDGTSTPKVSNIGTGSIVNSADACTWPSNN